MLYHFNDVDNKENNILTTSFRNDETAPLLHRSGAKPSVSSRKKILEASFSERFECVLETKSSICEIVFPRKSTLILCTYLMIFVLYLYMGALCFKAIELGKEKQDRSAFYQFRTEFLKNHSELKDSELEEFIKQVQALTSRGVSPLGNATVMNYNWDFSNAVFFATSLITTIGYGNDKPVTVGGRVFCIFFVIIGIPLMMIMTSAVVERLFLFVDLLFSALFYKLQLTISEDRFREIQIIFCFGALAVCFYIIPTIALYNMEESRWSVLDALYFCVISLTTIGLGDLVPGDGPDLVKRNNSRILATVYLFTGLLFTSFCIRAFHRHQHWNLAEKFIYLPKTANQNTNFPADSMPSLSDSFSNDYYDEREDQVYSYPVKVALRTSETQRNKRMRYHSIS